MFSLLLSVHRLPDKWWAMVSRTKDQGPRTRQQFGKQVADAAIAIAIAAAVAFTPVTIFRCPACCHHKTHAKIIKWTLDIGHWAQGTGHWRCINWDAQEDKEQCQSRSRFRQDAYLLHTITFLLFYDSLFPLEDVDVDGGKFPEELRPYEEKQTWAALAIHMNDSLSACRRIFGVTPTHCPPSARLLGMLGKSLFYDLWPHKYVRKICGRDDPTHPRGGQTGRSVVECKSYLQWYCNWIRPPTTPHPSLDPMHQPPATRHHNKHEDWREFNFT